MLSQIEDFVNWVRRRNPTARTWRDYSYDLKQFAATEGLPWFPADMVAQKPQQAGFVGARTCAHRHPRRPFTHQTNKMPHLGVKVSTSIRLPQAGHKPDFSSLAETLFTAVAVMEST